MANSSTVEYKGQFVAAENVSPVAGSVFIGSRAENEYRKSGFPQ